MNIDVKNRRYLFLGVFSLTIVMAMPSLVNHKTVDRHIVSAKFKSSDQGGLAGEGDRQLHQDVNKRPSSQ